MSRFRFKPRNFNLKWPIVKSLISLAFVLISLETQSQILISLLFGEALNTDKIEFGLTGGLNRSNLLGLPEAEGLNNFNLGFYFHIALRNDSFISTGVLVKNNLGATGMPTYPIGDPSFDGIFANGTLTTKVHYFQVPIMWQQRVQRRWMFEAGIQPGIRTRAYDFFKTENNQGKIEFERDVRQTFTRLDFGLVGGMGYKLKKDLKSSSIGVLYYYGLVDVKTSENISVQNSSLNLYLRIPIGLKEQTEN